AAYCAAMDKAREVYEQLAAFNPDVAAYIVPNGFNRRVLLHLNLRSLVHFIRLRSAPNAHFSVRRVAQRMAEEISAHFPELSPLLGRNENETSKNIETTFFTNTHVVS
ncbi:MAG TPA: FAD-dependent thymidylate synthase, partial [Anaerolineaceae bacterium]|nr:FAD-dependent thymidylate synthase [Anaerolineaceae bacterium]